MKPIVIVSPHKNKYSETFIQNHIRYLPANIHLLHGGYLPTLDANDQSLMRSKKWLDFFLSSSNDERLTDGIKNYLKLHKIEAVLAEFGPTGALIHPICKALNIPLIVHFHGFGAHKEAVVATYLNEYRKMFKVAKAIIVVSKEMHQQLIRLGAPESKVHYLTLGVDIELFHPNINPVTDPNFIVVGRFVSKKAPDLCIKAFAKVHEQFQQARLTMVGEGPLMEACQKLAKDLNIQNAITFTGALSPIEVAQALQQSSCFIQHSIKCTSGDAEGTPLSVMEAGASGLPVVASAHAGIPQIIEHGKSGFLFEEGDVDSMVKFMIDLVKNPEKGCKMGMVGREIICQKFEVAKKTLLLWDIIEKSIK